MRNWHHRVIKLDEALALFTSNNKNNRTVIGVYENSQIEVESLTTPLNGLNYKAKNKGLFKVIDNNVQKASLIGNISGNVSENITIGNSSSHTTSVAGIILGNEYDSNNNVLPIRGIIEDAELINFKSNYINVIMSSVDNSKFFFNNGVIIDPLFNSELSKLVLTYNNSVYIPSSKQVQIINASFTVNNLLPSDKAIFNVLFNTIKTYGNNGRGVLFVASAGNNGSKNTIDIQPFAKNYEYPLIVSAITIDDSKYFNEIKELRSSYSCYGERVDICGPSNGGKNGIYSTTNLKCGEIGYDDEVITKTITNQLQNGNLTLDNTDQIFPGNCMEIGALNSINHEVLIIKKVDRKSKMVEFINDRFYTATPFIINPATVKVPILKTNANIIGINKNRFSVTDNRGFGYVGQEICIFNGISNHYATISAVNSSTQFEFNPVLPTSYVTTNVEVIPGQIIIDSSSYIPGDNTKFIFSPSDDNILNSFFVGAMVAVYDTSSSPTFLGVANIEEIITVGTRTISLGKYNLASGYSSMQLRSVGYGSYTSSFGGTSAAAPVISGVAGVVVKANPNLNSIEIKHILKETADKIVIDENSSNGRWKDINGVNINFSNTSTLSAATIIGNNEIFVNNISLYNVNDSIEIDSDFCSVIEKKLSDRLVLQLAVTKVYNSGKNVKKGAFPFHSGYFGTGRINAERAVQLALDWHDPAKTVLKPRLEIADKLNGTAIAIVPDGDVVDSPDIWVNEVGKTPTVPTPTNLLNTIDTLKDQTIYVKVRNTGTRQSFKECDLRVFVAFTDEVNPAFPFPTKWYDQADVKLLSVKEIPIIPAGGEATMEIEWKDIAKNWDAVDSWNPIDSTTGKRKKTYILAHIAPFDGLNTEVMRDNIRHNKQLSCKEIIVTHKGVNDRTAFIPSNKLDITVDSALVTKNYELVMDNVLTTDLTAFKVKATKKNNTNPPTFESVFFKKTDVNWALEDGSIADWITFQPPTETPGHHEEYTNIKFPHTINVKNTELEVKLEIVNI